MKLKQILKETLVDTGNDIEQFRELFFGGKYLIPSPRSFILSGREMNPIKYGVKKIRKNRVSRDTNNAAYLAIEALRKANYPNFPSRYRSIFGTQKEAIAREFGKVYLLFPEQNANIVCFNGDTTLKYLHNGLKYDKILETSLNIKRYPDKDYVVELRENHPFVYEVIKWFLMTESNSATKLEQLFDIDLYTFKQKIEKCQADMATKYFYRQDFVGALEGLYNFSVNSKKYFKEGKQFSDRITDAKEIMIECDTVLLVNIDFFNSAVEWDGSKYVPMS